MNLSPGLKVAIGAVVTLVVVFVVVRSRRSTTPADEPAKTVAPLTRSQRVEQRLQQLREAHERAMATGGKIEAPSGAPVDRNLIAPRVARNAPAGSPAGMPPAAGAPPDKQMDADGLDGDPDDIPTLKNVALTDPDPERRLAAITMLGASDDAQVVPILAQALSDQDEDVRMAAVQSLADFTGEAPVDALETALNDPSADIRYEALEALSDVGGDSARQAVEKALNDPDEDVQSLAAGILDMENTYDDTPGGQAQPQATAGAPSR